MKVCQRETKRVRDCIREKRMTGRRCDDVAKSLESCRQKWRKKNNAVVSHNGTRVLPNSKCIKHNDAVQACLKWRNGRQEKCASEIRALRDCMDRTAGTIAPATAMDRIWSDSRGR